MDLNSLLLLFVGIGHQINIMAAFTVVDESSLAGITAWDLLNVIRSLGRNPIRGRSDPDLKVEPDYDEDESGSIPKKPRSDLIEGGSPFDDESSEGVEMPKYSQDIDTEPRKNTDEDTVASKPRADLPEPPTPETKLLKHIWGHLAMAFKELSKKLME